MSLVCVADFEEKSKEKLETSALDYYQSGAGDQLTLKHNKEAFNDLRIRPRFLRDVSNLDISTEIFGSKLKWPVGIASTAMQRMAHPDGEVANAKAAGRAGSIFVLSTLATTSLEELAEKAPETEKWFQLYIYKNRLLTETLVRTAEKCGFKAIVLTVDAPVFGIRRRDVRNKFSLPSDLKLSNFTGIQAKGVKSSGASGINEYVASQFDDTLTWKDVQWLVNFTTLPVIAKGILTKEDALLALHNGCKGVIVSNHGARQVDGVPATIEVLPEIVKAVGNEIVVMMDGGVYQGVNVFRALALGAKYVFMGRPAIWGLAVNGQKGVEDVLDIVKKELENTLKLTGCASLKDIRSEMVIHKSCYSKL
ncbi:HAO1.2 family protein [Megaselia abdita]